MIPCIHFKKYIYSRLFIVLKLIKTPPQGGACMRIAFVTCMHHPERMGKYLSVVWGWQQDVNNGLAKWFINLQGGALMGTLYS
jgi:hypothetical protein